MNTSNGAWERTAIIFLAVFAVGVVTASLEDPPGSSLSQSADTLDDGPNTDPGGSQIN